MSENQEVAADGNIENTDDLDAFTTDFFGEKSPDAKPAEAEQDAETEVEESGEIDESQKDELEDEEIVEVAADAEPKPKSKVQERIDELVKQKHDAERKAADDIVALRKEFEDKLAALAPAKQVQTADEPDPNAVDADGVELYPLGEYDPLYIRDLTRYTLNAERAQAAIKDEEIRQATEQAAQRTALHTSWTEKVEPAKIKYPDFAEKGQVLLDGFSGLDSNYAEYLSTVLMSMDYGPDVLYYLSNNQDEATKIVNSGAQKATLALGRIEARFAEVEAQKVVAKPKLSNAPPPPTATARGTGGGVKTVEADTDDLDAFTDKFFAKRRR